MGILLTEVVPLLWFFRRWLGLAFEKATGVLTLYHGSCEIFYVLETRPDAI
jgi:hypothetical protein